MRNPFKDTNSKSYKVIINIVYVLIFATLVIIVIDTLPDLSSRTRRLLVVCDFVIIGAFTIEYFMRLAAAERKIKYFFSFFGLIDLIAILPFYFGLMVDTRGLRAFRLLRLFAVLKTARFSEAINKLKRAISDVKEEITVFFVLAGVVIYLCGVFVYFLEHNAQPEKFTSALDGFWWAIATMTTVGYGDIYPVTAGGKIFTGLVLLVGIAIVAVPTGLISSALTKQKS